MPTENDKAYSEGHGKQETERSPQPSPEDGRDDDCDRRDSGTVPEDEGLYHLTHRQFGDKVESGGEQEGRPAGFDDRCKQ